MPKSDEKGAPPSAQRSNGAASSVSGSGYAIVAFVGPVGLDVGQLAMRALNGQAGVPLPALSTAMEDVVTKARQHFLQQAAATAALKKAAALAQHKASPAGQPHSGQPPAKPVHAAQGQT